MNYIASFEEKIKKVITLEQHSQRETKNLKCVVQSIQKSEHIKREQKEDELTLMRHECKALKKKLIHMKKQDQLR